MKKVISAVASIVAVSLLPTAAQAEDAGQTEDAGSQVYVGVSGGYHDFGLDEDAVALPAGVEINDSSAIFGGFVGVDFPLGGNVFAGVEGNFHFGTDVVDVEYGGSGRLGIRSANGTKFYVRGGYQQVDLDLSELVNVTVPAGTFNGIDDSGGDFIAGAGVDFPIGRTALRFNLDTLSFDTVRGTVGFAFGF